MPSTEHLTFSPQHGPMKQGTSGRQPCAHVRPSRGKSSVTPVRPQKNRYTGDKTQTGPSLRVSLLLNGNAGTALRTSGNPGPAGCSLLRGALEGGHPPPSGASPMA